jgi:GNAT superfamily N-acetyltransferase
MERSARFVSAVAKELSGIKEGSTQSWTLRALKFRGICEEKFHVDNTNLSEDDYSNYSTISIEAFLDAEKNKIQYYQRLYSIDDCINRINKSGAITVAFDIFESIKNAPKGRVSLPRIGEAHLGSHCVLIHGYSTLKETKEKVFHFSNSWGVEWGDNGHGTIPFDYFKEGLVSSIFAIGQESEIRDIKKYKLKTNTGINFHIELSIYPPLRYIKYPIYVTNIFHKNMLVGHLMLVPINEKEVEIEDFYILPQHQDLGLGTSVLKHTQKKLKESGFSKIIGWIGAQDTILGREKYVKHFFIKNNFIIYEDNSRFLDSLYKFEKNI